MSRAPRRIAAAWFLRALLLGALAVVWFAPPLKSLDRTPDDASITSYDVAMDLAADGTLRSAETIVVALPAGKRGIFRVFDVADPRRPGVDHPVSDVTVTRDGVPEPWTWTESARGTETARIGSPSVFLPGGSYTYRIDSVTTGALEPGGRRNGRDETLWWWDVVGSGWQMAMDSVTVTARLPAVPLRAECVQGTDTPCTAEISERTLTVRTGPLAPYTPVTVRVAFPADALPPPPGGTDHSARDTLVAALLGALAAVGLVVATRERRPGFPVLFEPPAGVGPALGARVLHEDDAADALLATLYDLADRGVLRLEGDDERWHVRLLVDPATVELRPEEVGLLAAFLLHAPDDTFVVSATTTSGERVSRAVGVLRAQVHEDGRRYLRSSLPGILAWMFGWLAFAGVLVMTGVYFLGTGWRSWPLLALCGAFALVAMGMALDPAVRTVHTAEGRDLWTRVGGFSRFLTTPSSESRFDAAAHLDWYPRYLGWAMALGVADAWDRRYAEQGVELPAVPWIWWAGTGRFNGMAGLGASFDAAISSASATYAASQSSSGGGFSGGGFSGGSGGGGGGGGSW
ncbi:MAG: DUF2207 domain-containing protein [Microthrixaceae bacterium]